MWTWFFDWFLPTLSPEARIAVCNYIRWAMVGFFMIFAFNGFADVGLHGFARSDTVLNQQQEIRDINLSLLEAAILDTRIKHCSSTTLEARQFYANHLSELLRKYRDIVGSHFPVPSCQDLGYDP